MVKFTHVLGPPCGVGPTHGGGCPVSYQGGPEPSFSRPAVSKHYNVARDLQTTFTIAEDRARPTRCESQLAAYSLP